MLPTNESIISTIYQQIIFNKTNMKQINGFQILFVLTFLGFVKGSSVEGVVLPVMMFDEGETAHIPCIKEANDNDFFWSRGTWYENSTNIAYIARGIPSKSDKYDVYMDGTLVIRRTSLTDEGNYFCRILSDTTESYIGITINVRASPEKLDISIEGCNSGSNCVKILEPSSESQLVCTAEMISESMTLKWYNGTNQIIGDLDVPETGQNGKISNVITFTFKEDSILTCKAEGANIEETTAFIQLRKKEESVSIENDDTSILLILAVVLGITCITLLGLLITSILCYRNLKKGQRRTKDTDNIETDTGTLDDTIRGQDTKEVSNTRSQSPKSQQEDTEEGKSEEKETLLDKNDKSSSTKDKEIQRLQEEVTKKDGDLKKKEEAVKSLETKLEETIKSLEKKDKELMTTSNELKKRENKLQKLQKEITNKNNDLKMKEEEVKSLQTELTETKEAVEKKNKELITTSNELKKKEDELKTKAFDKEQQTANVEKGLQKKLQDTTEKLTTAENANKNLCAKIAELKKGTVQYLTKTSVRVAIVLKPERFRWEKSKLLALSSKYNTICAVLSNTPSEDLTVMTENIVESTFDGANNCIVIFGNQESELVSTLHGDANVKGLIEGISNQIVSVLEKRKAKGFKVTLKICNKGEQSHSPKLFNAEGQVVPNQPHRWENHTVYEVKTVEEVTNLTSRMAPNESHLNMQGFIRFIIEIPPSTGQKISRNLTIVSLIGVKHIPRFWTANQPLNAFEKLLFPVFRDNGTIRFLIGHCHPDQEDGVEETCKATKQVLDAMIASKSIIEQQS